MFTGIVQGTAEVLDIKSDDQFSSFRLAFPSEGQNDFATGASIALNGTCLTVRSFNDNCVWFDAIASTLRLTNLGQLEVGSRVNFERAARIGDEIGGHLMSGHIIDQISIIDIERTDTNCRIVFERPERYASYLLDKGFVGLNGCSLTITDLSDQTFSVWLIPETLERTLFGQARIGDRVNLEIDPQTQAIVDTVERYMAQRELLK